MNSKRLTTLGLVLLTLALLAIGGEQRLWARADAAQAVPESGNFEGFLSNENVLQLRKTVGLDPTMCALTDAIDVGEGAVVTYCFEVTNTGQTPLALHDLEDSHLGVILAGLPFTLLPDASVFLTQTALITQTTINSAMWTAYNPGPVDVVTVTDVATVTVVPPSISLRKTVGLDPSMCALTDAIDVGEGTAVTYCFEVTNTGQTPLALHDLEDSHLGVILAGLPFTLLPDASVFLTQTALITHTTINSAMWTAYNPGPVDVVTATDVATVTVVPPSISLRKTVGLDPSMCALTDAIDVGEGTAVTYCFEVTNTGQTPLTLHDLEDSHLGVILAGLSFTLLPDASVFLTQTALITQTTINSAMWTAYNPGPVDVVTATDTATVNVAVEPFRVYLPLVVKE